VDVSPLLELVQEHCETFLRAEVLPYRPDAWIEHSKIKVGYEIPFNRHFYEYVARAPPRPDRGRYRWVGAGNRCHAEGCGVMDNPRRQTEDASLFQSLPPGWREERLQDVVELRTSNVDKKSADAEEPVKLCNYVDVYHHDRIDSDIDFMEATASQAQIERFSLKVGDVVITKDSESPHDIGVPALVSESIPDLVCGYHLTILRRSRRLLSAITCSSHWCRA
jgi:hypothetical protein